MQICRHRLARSRTPGFHPGNQGFESPWRYQIKSGINPLFIFRLFLLEYTNDRKTGKQKNCQKCI